MLTNNLNGAMSLLQLPEERPPVLSLLPLKQLTLLLFTVKPLKVGSSLPPKLSTLLLLIMEVNLSPSPLLTRKLLVISLTTMLFLRFVVNLLKLWLFHIVELLMLMVDSLVHHLHLSQLLLQLLPRLTPLLTRLECCKLLIQLTPLTQLWFKLNGS